MLCPLREVGQHFGQQVAPYPMAENVDGQGVVQSDALDNARSCQRQSRFTRSHCKTLIIRQIKTRPPCATI